MQVVSSAAEQISASGHVTVQETRAQTMQSTQDAATLLLEIRALRGDISRYFTAMPRQWAQAAAKVIQ